MALPLLDTLFFERLQINPFFRAMPLHPQVLGKSQIQSVQLTTFDKNPVCVVKLFSQFSPKAKRMRARNVVPTPVAPDFGYFATIPSKSWPHVNRKNSTPFYSM